MTKDTQLAQDIVHDTFVALYFYKKDSDFDNMNKIKAWLIKTSINKTINFLKKRKKIVYLSPKSFARLEDNASFMPDTTLEKNETNLEIRKAIDYLAPELKSLIILYYFTEMPQAEIAETLEIPLGTVKSRLNKARTLLKKHLAKYNQKFVSESEKNKKKGGDLP